MAQSQQQNHENLRAKQNHRAVRTSVPSKGYQLGPIRQNLNYFIGSLSQNFQFFAENRLIYQEKASFLHIVTKSVEPIFQGLEPIVRHRALRTIAVNKVTNRWRNHNNKTTKISELNKIIELYEL